MIALYSVIFKDQSLLFPSLSRGLQFFTNLEKNILKLEKKCKEFCDDHGSEMAKLLEKAKKKEGK